MRSGGMIIQRHAIFFAFAPHTKRGGDFLMHSIWTEQVTLPQFEPLRGDARADVLVIGGGMAGLLCARLLTDAGVDCALAEADTLCGGVTQNTTAKITAQHGLIYDKLIREFGEEQAKRYLNANLAALERYRQMCADIDCDFETRDAYVYARGERKKIDDELRALDALGFHAAFAQELPLPFPVAGAVRFAEQAQFHPLKFAAAIAPGLRVYEHTPVRTVAGGTAEMEHGRITAERIITATHFPIWNRHGAYFLKLYQHRSYVIALENAPDVHGMYVDEAEKGMSFRNYKDFLLLGGGDHRTGKRGGGWKELQDFAGKHYPDAKLHCQWATQDCMSLDGAPYIGPYSKRTPQLFVAAGFNKWGMTGAMVSAMILSDLVTGRENEFAPAFVPSRTIWRPQLAVNAAETLVNFLTPTTRRCPHLGCALKWNSQEHSWDCPCHGSRFAVDGALLENPATGDWHGAPGKEQDA